MKSEVVIMFCLLLCSAHYTAVQLKNSARSFSAMNPVTTENAGENHDKACIMLSQINTLHTAKHDKANSIMVYFTYWLAKRHILG